MPRIEEYTPQVDASGPAGGISPNIEQVGMFGRGMEKAGSDLGQISDALYKRQETQETSDIYATMADKRAELNDQLTQQTNDGTLDSNKFKQDYDDWVQQQADQYETASGKNYFTRQAARLGGTMLTKAARGQAVVQSNNTKADLQNGLNTDGGTLGKDPTQFDDVYSRNMEHLDQLVSQGQLSAKDAPKFREAVGTQLAQSTLRGYINQDPDQAAHMLASGGFDQFLNAQQKKEMGGEIRQAQNAAEIDSTRQENLAKKADAAAGSLWLNNNLSKFADGTITAKDVINAPGLPEKKFELLEKIRSGAALQDSTEPSAFNELMNRMHLPDNDPKKISDFSQVMSIPGVSNQDLPKLQKLFNTTDEGKAIQVQRKQLLDYGRAALVKQAGLSGNLDADGEYNYMNYTKELLQAEEAQKAAGKPVSDLYNVQSPQWFGTQLNRFKLDGAQILAQQAARIRGDSVQVPKPVFTSPGIVPSTATTPGIMRASPLPETQGQTSTGNSGEIETPVVQGPHKGKTAVFDSKHNFLRWKQ